MAIWNIQHQNGSRENIYVPDWQIQRAQPPPQVVRQVVHERPHINVGHAAGAAIGVILVGGIVCALCRSTVGRMILIGLAIWFCWSVNQSMQADRAQAKAQAEQWATQRKERAQLDAQLAAQQQSEALAQAQAESQVQPANPEPTVRRAQLVASKARLNSAQATAAINRAQDAWHEPRIKGSVRYDSQTDTYNWIGPSGQARSKPASWFLEKFDHYL